MKKLLGLLFFLYLVIFPFGQLGRVEFTPEVTLHLIDVVVGTIACIAVYGAWRRKFRTPPFTREFIWFFGVIIFSLVVNYKTVEPLQFLAGSLYSVRLLGYFFFYLALWNLFQEGDWRERLPGYLLKVGFFISFFGFAQYIFFPDFGALANFGWDPHLYRLAGTFLDTGFAGILIVLFLVLLFSKFWPSLTEAYGRVRWGTFMLLLPLGLFALALTYSRASYLAYLFLAITFHIVRRNLLWFSGAVLALTLLVALLPKTESEGANLSRTSTITYRVNSYKNALDVISNNPVFGVGYNLYRYTQTDRNSHGASGTDSSALLVLATTGFAGFFVFLQLIVKILAKAWQERKTQLGMSLLASLVAVGVHSVFDNSLFYPWVLGWLIIMLAAVEQNSSSA